MPSGYNESMAKARDCVDFPSGDTPELAMASAAGDLSRMKILIDAGADVDARDARKWSSLMWATRQWELEAMQLLLESGAPVESVSEQDWSALTWTARDAAAAPMALLLKWGASPTREAHSPFGSGLSPLHYVVAGEGDSLRDKAVCARLLVEHGALDGLSSAGRSKMARLVENCGRAGGEAIALEMLKGMGAPEWTQALEARPELVEMDVYVSWRERREMGEHIGDVKPEARSIRPRM